MNANRIAEIIGTEFVHTIVADMATANRMAANKMRFGHQALTWSDADGAHVAWAAA